MKVVLQDHVENLGERGDVVAVAPGYARNYLLPKKLALAATTANLKLVAERRKIWEVHEAREVAEAQAAAARLAALDIEVLKKAGEAGTLYGSVTSSEIAALLAQQGITVDRRRLQIAQAIKAVGEYEIGIKLHPKVVGRFKVRVMPEGGPPPVDVIVDEVDADEEDSDDDDGRSGRRRRRPAERA